MSRLVRCNRCGTEGDVTLKPSGVAVVDAMAAFAGVSKFTKWTSMVLSPLAGMVKLKSVTADLCEDCTEVLVEQFLVGGAVAPITQPLTQVVLPHEPMTDCQLVWNPGKGRFLCYHEDPELYHALILDNAQNVAEGVPEKPVTETSLMERARQLSDDVAMAGYAHATPQRCSAACSEAHTYREGCLLANVVSDVPGQISPPACGEECGKTNPDGSMTDPHHTYNLGTCLMNRDTAHAVLVVCPVCKEEGSMSSLVSHMAKWHQFYPDYANHQWVDKNGYDLDGRLISQQGEDLTDAYSPQEPAPVEGVDIPQQRDSEE